MKPVRATLIDLFSRLPCAVIEDGAAKIVQAFDADSFASVAALPQYAEEYNRVRTAKRQLERIEATYSSANGDQALQSLCLLKDLRAQTKYINDDYLVTRELIATTLHHTWPAPDQQRYDERRQVFDEWSDFFISYTNRGAIGTNNRYRKLISENYGWPGQAEIAAHNYVARVIAKFFEAEDLRAFVDFKTLQCGDDIGEKIVQHCRSTFAFVQLVEKVALSDPLPVTANWCHIEYGQFMQAAFPTLAAAPVVNRKFFFLSGTAQLEKPVGMSQPYEPWYQEISKRLHVVIDMHNFKPWDQLVSEVRGVALQIAAARQQLINAMLATWA